MAKGSRGKAQGAAVEEAASKKAAARRSAPRPRQRRPSRAAHGAANTVEAALAAFAHEVRTPLTGILAISNLLATSDLGERERRWVDTIKAGAEHLASLATLFVDAARSRGAMPGGRICSTCARSPAASAIRSPAVPPPRACRRASTFPRNCRRS